MTEDQLRRFNHLLARLIHKQVLHLKICRSGRPELQHKISVSFDIFWDGFTGQSIPLYMMPDAVPKSRIWELQMLLQCCCQCNRRRLRQLIACWGWSLLVRSGISEGRYPYAGSLTYNKTAREGFLRLGKILERIRHLWSNELLSQCQWIWWLKLIGVVHHWMAARTAMIPMWLSRNQLEQYFNLTISRTLLVIQS